MALDILETKLQSFDERSLCLLCTFQVVLWWPDCWCCMIKSTRAILMESQNTEAVILTTWYAFGRFYLYADIGYHTSPNPYTNKSQVSSQLVSPRVRSTSNIVIRGFHTNELVIPTHNWCLLPVQARINLCWWPRHFPFPLHLLHAGVDTKYARCKWWLWHRRPVKMASFCLPEVWIQHWHHMHGLLTVPGMGADIPYRAVGSEVRHWR